MERKYSISEIDAMRAALSRMFPWGCSYQPSERAADVENRLRTHMLNSTDPEELERAAKEHTRKELERQRETWAAEQRFRAAKAEHS